MQVLGENNFPSFGINWDNWDNWDNEFFVPKVPDIPEKGKVVGTSYDLHERNRAVAKSNSPVSMESK